MVASLTEADLLIILSDIEGLYDKNPQEYNDAKLISFVEEITAAVEQLAGGIGSTVRFGRHDIKNKSSKNLFFFWNCHGYSKQQD